ncbi:MAG: endo-1,4-beta-xylanase, partial [Treponema sp.]|nr:endo-1,4-beta-xylanase [Treponema sp.]
ITWGFTDNHSWVPGTFPGTGEALLYTKSMEPKLVYEKMLEVLRK